MKLFPISNSVLVSVEITSTKKFFEYEDRSTYLEGTVKEVPAYYDTTTSLVEVAFLKDTVGSLIVFNKHQSEKLGDSEGISYYKVPVESIMYIVE